MTELVKQFQMTKDRLREARLKQFDVLFDAVTVKSAKILEICTAYYAVFGKNLFHDPCDYSKECETVFNPKGIFTIHKNGNNWFDVTAKGWFFNPQHFCVCEDIMLWSDKMVWHNGLYDDETHKGEAGHESAIPLAEYRADPEYQPQWEDFVSRMVELNTLLDEKFQTVLNAQREMEEQIANMEHKIANIETSVQDWAKVSKSKKE